MVSIVSSWITAGGEDERGASEKKTRKNNLINRGKTEFHKIPLGFSSYNCFIGLKTAINRKFDPE